MANPTTNFGWTIPVEGQDPWYTALTSVFSAMDVSVHSIEVSLQPRTTMVLSVTPTATSIVNSASFVLMGADGGWTINSTAPYGRYVGSFSIVTSGAHAFFDLRMSAFVDGPSMSFSADIPTRLRLVVQRTGANSLVVPSNSAWVFRMQYNSTHIQFPRFVDVRSLGPGKYSVEMQTSGLFTIGSRIAIGSGDKVTLMVTETRLAL